MLNVTVATIVSPRSYVALDNGAFSDSPVTPGGPCAPSTLWLPAFTIAVSPSVAACVASRASLIAPLFSASAVAPMLIPSASVSVARTV